MVTNTLKKQLLLGFIAMAGLGAIQGCGDDDNVGSVPSAGSAGIGGKAAGGASSAGTTGKAGSTPSDAGTPNEAAGSSGEGPGEAGAAGSAGAAGEAGSESGGTGGTGGSTAGTGGTGGANAGSGGAGGTAGASTAFTLQTTSIGQVIGAANNRTLYVFKNDTPGAGATAPVSACSGNCLGLWPIYYANPVTVPAGLSASDFGSFDRGAGVLQSTYKGWPLYFYSLDAKAEDVKGDNFGGNWFAAKVPFVAPK